MTFSSRKLILFFRYLWLILALCFILYILDKNLIQSESLVYQLDFQHNITQNTEGPYPANRTKYLVDTGDLEVLAEPLYLQVYLPTKFSILDLESSWDLAGQSLQVGLKQQDGSWLWQKMSEDDALLSFDLQTANLNNNKTELIFSLPDLEAGSSVFLHSLSLILNK